MPWRRQRRKRRSNRRVKGAVERVREKRSDSKKREGRGER